MFAATTGRVIMKVVKMGAQLLSPNQMSEMTIHTKTEVELRTVTTSCTTLRARRARKAASPRTRASSTAAATATVGAWRRSSARPDRLSAIEELATDALGVVPDVRLQEAELLV